MLHANIRTIKVVPPLSVFPLLPIPFIQATLKCNTMGFSVTQRRPITKVPPEILLLIFEAYCQVDTPIESSTRNERRITHICRYWRSLTLDLPTLWATLNISPKTPLVLLSVYLKRSHDVPLNITIDLRHDPADEETHLHTLELWEAIKTTIGRWRRLVIHNDPEDATPVYDDLRQVAAPILEDITMTSKVYTGGETQLFNGQTPRLKTLQLSDLCVHQFHSSFENLTSLDLASSSPMSFSTFRELMGQMGKLKQLSLRNRAVEGWPVYPITPDDIVILPSLTDLKLSDRRWPLFVPLLTIAAPILHSLSLYDLVGHDFPDASVEHFLLVQYPSVRNLLLKGQSTFIDEPSFSQLTRMFPAVEQFAFHDVDSAFINDVCHSLHEPATWPNLRTLSMVPMVAEGILCSLISVRNGSTKRAGLKKLVGPKPMQFKRMEWISQRVKCEECHNDASGVGLQI